MGRLHDAAGGLEQGIRDIMSLKRSGFVAGAAVGVGLTAAIAVGAGIQLQRASAQSGAIQPVAPPSVMPPTGAPMSFATIIERVAPAVVSIEVTTHLPPQRAMQIPGLPFQFNMPNQGNGDDQGDDGDDSDQGQDQGPQTGNSGGAAGRHAHRNTGPRAMAAGSGFFISPDGYIVTNNHVIENADSIKVTLSDQRELTAHLIGRDPLTDLAVIKVDGTKFPYVNFESQAKPRVGDWVIAIGNPYLLGGTVTAGIVSSERRSIPGENQVVPYLQIDAPINRGNSGGPTFDVFGRVIGVNTAIFSESGGSVGIGFAIPADLANTITRELIAHGHVSHGYLGVLIQPVTADIAAAEGIEPNHGALVGDVTAGGPGAAAGVQTGDIIQGVNGPEVKSAADLSQITSMTLPGEPLHLKVLRNGHVIELTAKAGTRPSNEQIAENENGAEGGGGPAGSGAAATTRVLGMSLAPLSDALRQQYNIGPSVHGVVITRVAPDSEAGQDGLRPGVVIIKAGDHLAQTPADVAAAVADARHDHRPSVLLFLSLGGRPAAIPLKLDPEGAPAPH
jgi:serine protease Do